MMTYACHSCKRRLSVGGFRLINADLQCDCQSHRRTRWVSGLDIFPKPEVPCVLDFLTPVSHPRAVFDTFAVSRISHRQRPSSDVLAEVFNNSSIRCIGCITFRSTLLSFELLSRLGSDLIQSTLEVTIA